MTTDKAAEATSGESRLSDMLYGSRNPMELDKAGNYYCKHVMAMTAEGLHSKSDIAMELGHRDRLIDELKVALRVATIAIEDRVQLPKDAPFLEKCRELTGYKPVEKEFDKAPLQYFSENPIDGLIRY